MTYSTKIFTRNVTRNVTSTFHRTFLRGVGIAATGGLLLGGPAMAEVRPVGERAEPVTNPAPSESSASLSGLAEAGPSDRPAAAVPTLESAPSVAAPSAELAPQAAPDATLIAQTYPQPEVKEVYSAQGWYLTIGAGYQHPSDQSISTPLIDQDFSPFTVNLGGGFSGDLGVGYDFGVWRAELTYGYSRASLNGLSAGNAFTNNVSGAINKNDVLASLYYDFENNSRWTPYIGGGIGYTNLSTPSFTLDGIPTNSVNKGLFGWQGKIGVSYAMSYNSDIYVEGVYQGAGGYSAENLNVDSFNSFGGKIGFRYRFGARPVAAAPAPTPEPEPVMQPAPAPAPVFQPEPAPAPIRGLW
jgi:opacity protein-like surface antigen